MAEKLGFIIHNPVNPLAAEGLNQPAGFMKVFPLCPVWSHATKYKDRSQLQYRHPLLLSHPGIDQKISLRKGSPK